MAKNLKFDHIYNFATDCSKIQDHIKTLKSREPYNENITGIVAFTTLGNNLLAPFNISGQFSGQKFTKIPLFEKNEEQLYGISLDEFKQKFEPIFINYLEQIYIELQRIFLAAFLCLLLQFTILQMALMMLLRCP